MAREAQNARPAETATVERFAEKPKSVDVNRAIFEGLAHALH